MELLYLVRHGETEWNRKNLCMGQLDIPLNDLGIRQAERLAERLSKIKIDALYSSDLSRASQTAQIIAKRRTLRPIAMKDLREIFLGEYQGLSTEELRERFPSAYLIPSGKAAQAKELAYPEIETRTQLYNRGVKILNQISDQHPNQTVVIVSHGGLIRCLTSYVLGQNANYKEAIFYSLAMDCSNCSITLVRKEPDGLFKLAVVNDTSHLDGLHDESVDERDFG
ncbi:histidine phosphatase family protein [Candidatus Acetothermia bacterium]|nr:histidine phosphatase family protein [Candidatus Acetothermia bacterium]MBI3643450.1 histidine phosphatase family protein [Candidatus Acetothermia bacterium]